MRVERLGVFNATGYVGSWDVCEKQKAELHASNVKGYVVLLVGESPYQLPCPFCGNVFIGQLKTLPYQIVCRHCGAEGPNALTTAEAEEKWNTRSKEVKR